MTTRKIFKGILLLIIAAFVAAAATAQNDGCKSPVLLNNDSGTIITPFYHQYPDFTYPVNAKCRWSIRVSPGKNIRITFGHPISMEANPTCEYDWVSIITGNQDTSQTLCIKRHPKLVAGPFCPPPNQPQPPAPLIVVGNMVDIEFCTDDDISSQGFLLNYQATDEEPTVVATPPPTNPPTPVAPICGGTITVTDDHPQYFETPAYPDTYPNNARCVWNISGPTGYALLFNSEGFHLEENDCMYDALTFTDLTLSGGLAGNMDTNCGTVGFRNLRSSGSSVLAQFKSDLGQAYSGFRVRIDATPCPSGSDLCPNAGSQIACYRPENLCDGTSNCPNSADEHCPMGCGVPPKSPILSTRNTPRIVGGIEAKPHTWPWQVSVLDAGWSHICGGSIIDHYWIVTAASCCTTFQLAGPNNYRVRVGEHDLDNGLEINAWTYDLDRAIPHPNYNNFFSLAHIDNICLLKTRQPILFNDHVHPICLGSGPTPPVGKDCYVTGWGSNETSSGRSVAEKSSRILRQVDVKIVKQTDCRSPGDPDMPFPAELFCAVNPGKDSCRDGDTGGPLVCPTQADPRIWELVGIINAGRGCANPDFPGVYTRISSYLEWIIESISKV